MKKEVNITPKFFSDPLAWMIHHSVSANLMMAILLAIGFVLMLGIKKEVFPDFDSSHIIVTASYKGVSADNLEDAVAVPIENAIADIDGIGDVKTTITEGAVNVRVEVLDKDNIAAIFREMQNKVDGISTFPDDMARPVVSIPKNDVPLMFLMVSGNIDENSLKNAMQLIRSVFAQNIETGSISVYGDIAYEVRVEISNNNLRKYNLTLAKVGAAIAAAGMDLSTGTIKNDKEKVNLRFNYRKYSAEDFKNIVVLASANGSPLYLKDIANIYNSYEDVDSDVSSNNKPAMFFTIAAKEGQTPQSVSKAVTNEVKKVQSLLPKGVSLDILLDMSKTFNERAHILIREGLIGICLVILILGLFLEARLAFWTSWGIPISFLGAFILLYLTIPLTGFSINIISLFAFIIVLGIVVDDAIVVGENVYSYKERLPNNPKAATALGVKEVASSVFFSIFTNIVSFLPLAFLPGMMGKFLRQIPIVIIFVLLVSLFESLFILPARIAFKHKQPNPNSKNPFIWFKIRFNKGMEILIKYYYAKLLIKVIAYRYIALSFIIGFSIVFFAFLSSGKLGFILMPQAEGDSITLTANFPYTTTLQTKIDIRKRLVQNAMDLGDKYGGKQEYKNVEADIGNNVLNVRVFLNSGKKPLSAFAFLEKWKAMNGPLTGVTKFFYSASFGSPGGDANITLEITAPDAVTLAAATNALVNKLSKYDFVTHVNTDQELGAKEYNFIINDIGRALGLTPVEVAKQVNNAVSGYRSIQQIKNHNTLNVVVKLPKNEINSINSLNNILISTAKGAKVPLSDIAGIEEKYSAPVINRLNYQRSIEVLGYVNPDSKSSEVLNNFLTNDFPKISKEYPGTIYLMGGQQKEMQKAMKALIIGFILTLITIYTALAMFFNSYIQPLIIMVAIPFGFIGAIIGHLIMGFPLSIPSMFGLLALSGVVVNASMIIIYFSNLMQKEYNVPAKLAIVRVSKRRFRPILLTSLTAFFGMLPTIVSTSSQVAFLRPIAVALGFGVIFSTIITLICMPIFYLIVEDIRNFFFKPQAENL